MSGKRSLFDVIEGGKEIEKDLNLTSMEKISKGVDKLIEMTNDAFKHIESLEDAIGQTDALASKTKRELSETKRELEQHIYENRARHGALVEEIKRVSERISIIQEYTALLLERAGYSDVADLLKDEIKRQRREEEEHPF